MAALALIETAPDPFAVVRAWRRMRAAGFALSFESDGCGDASERPIRLPTRLPTLPQGRAGGIAERRGKPYTAPWGKPVRLALAGGKGLRPIGRMTVCLPLVKCCTPTAHVNCNERRYDPRSAPANAETPSDPQRGGVSPNPENSVRHLFAVFGQTFP